jgi:hypothetical protein
MTALEDTRAGDLTAEQLLHLYACKRAVENGDPPPLEYETRELTVEERLYRTAEIFRTWCDDEEAIATDLAWKLVRIGYSTDQAEEVLRSVGITWTAKSSS